MALDVTPTFTQTGTELAILQALENLLRFCREVSDPDHFQRRFDSAYSSTDTAENRAKVSGKTLCENQLATNAFNGHAILLARIEDRSKGLFSVIDSEVIVSQTDRDAGAIAYIHRDDDGEISITSEQGYWAALKREMVTLNEFIEKNTVTISPSTFSSFAGNKGSLVLTGTPLGSDHMFSGTLIAECVDEALPRPQFSVEIDLDVPFVRNNQQSLVTDNQLLSVGKKFTEGFTGIQDLQMDFDNLLETGDDGDMLSSVSITLPADGDGAGGFFHVQVKREGLGPTTQWLLKFFSDSDRTTVVFDAKTEAGNDIPEGESGVQTFTYTLAKGSQFKFTINKTKATVKLLVSGDTDDDIVYNLQSPKVGDRFRLDVVNLENGKFATKIGKNWRVSLNSRVGATISDSLADDITIP